MSTTVVQKSKNIVGQLATSMGIGRKASAIERIIESNLLRIVYQPVVDLQNGQVFAYEALARSAEPGFDSPVELFRAAIEAECCGLLGRTLRTIAMDGCAEFPLFININPNEFDEGWLVRPDDPIFMHDLPVYLEITESVPLSHFELCRSVLKEIRVKHVKLAVDDLGAGYSNLKYIADLSPEVVKIDRELIAGSSQGSRQQRLVKAIVNLCDALGAQVVCEGIETLDELKAVIDSGAQFGQGFFLARPAFPLPEVHWPF